MIKLPFNSPKLATATALKTALNISPEQPVWWVFDFDGVLAKKDEDLLYKLPVTNGEYKEISRLASAYNILPETYEPTDTAYLRALVLQDILEAINEPILAGPLLPLAQQLTEPYFVNTARSNMSLLTRVFKFLNTHNLTPQEVFGVGRASKNPQLQYIAELKKDAPQIIYIDDSLEHIKAADSLNISHLHTVYVDYANYKPEVDPAVRYQQILNSVN